MVVWKNLRFINVIIGMSFDFLQVYASGTVSMHAKATFRDEDFVF